jgi:phosphoribosylformylglycinamidine (FGAM) synthase-like amidotransferase family enzyme
VCRTVTVRVENNATPFTSCSSPGQLLRIPVAHGEGCYFADQHTLDRLERDRRVILRYVDNPNGSLRDIAGISNERGNVMGLMPHPERAADVLMGSTDGRVILESMVHSLVSSINNAA